MSFFEELKRRRVFRVASTYAVIAFVIMQLVEILFPMFNFPQWTQQFIVIVVLLGFPVAVIISWIFDKTPQGFIKTDAVNAPVKEQTVLTRPFYKKKRNWFLVFGVVAGVMIGRIGGGEKTIEKISDKSIAVLPFENLSNDANDEYFADGMTEDILTELSKIKDLLVISRTTIMKYKGSNKTLKEIGKELGVANILEGSVRRVGDRVRITGQLINARNDQHLWAEKYDRDIEDIFQVQDEVATAIANALRIELSDEETRLITSTQTGSIEAYDLYIKGRSVSYSYSLPNIYKAIDYFTEAIRVDPKYALAYAGIARARTMLSYFLFHDEVLFKESLKEAKVNAERAIQLGPDDAQVQFAMGFYLNRQNYSEAYPYFMKVITLNPSHAHAHDEIGDIYLDYYGDLDQALNWFEKALKRDPDLPPAGWLKIEIALKKGQVEKGLLLADEGLKRHPNVQRYSTIKHAALMMAHEYNEAYEFINDQEHIFQTAERMSEYYQAKGLTLISLNKFNELDEVLIKLERTKFSDRTHEYRYLNSKKKFYQGDYRGSIDGFKDLLYSNVVVQTESLIPVLKDICHFWMARSYIELGEYDKAITELNLFRPTYTGSSLPLMIDIYWPMKNYLKGKAYEGLGDTRNARESFEDFLQVWSEADDDLPEIVDAKKRLSNLDWSL